MLALNPPSIAEARQLDAERAAGRVRGPLHGIPVAFKDNIDVLGLPTTGGSLALVDHRPRLDSRVAAGMRSAGAVVLGKANLDEFPFGDFGISIVGGTIGNAYDPSLSTAGSSGGSAVGCVVEPRGARVRHRHVQLAVEPGVVRVAGDDPHDARADEPRRRDAAEHLQRRRRSDREVGSRAGAGARCTSPAPTSKTKPPQTRLGTSSGSFAAARSTAARLKGARIGVMRQLFVGVTGEREAADADGTRRRGADRRRALTSSTCRIPILDERYRAARGSAPGSLKAGWTAYLSRGARPGDTVLTHRRSDGVRQACAGERAAFRDALSSRRPSESRCARRPRPSTRAARPSAQSSSI